MDQESAKTTISFAVTGSVDAGKCFSKGTQILLYSGKSINVENITVGAVLMGDDSTPRTVVETHTGYGSMYDILADNKYVCTVNKHHILCLKYKSKNVEMSVNDFMKLSDDKKSQMKWFRTSVNFPEIPISFALDLNNISCVSSDEIKYNSFNVRSSIVKKILDVTNHISENRVLISNVDHIIIKNIDYLIRSIGGKTFNHKRLSHGYEFDYDLNCSLECDIEIKQTHNDVYYGFQITGNGRFLLPDFSVVHNSSFVGVMTHPKGELDDGNGKAREDVAIHKHEKESGRTSDISTRPVVIPSKNEVVTLVDLCGHEKYFKTTAYGVEAHFVDYGFLIVGANRGVLPMTKQHMKLLVSSGIPVIIVITRIDASPMSSYLSTLEQISQLCTLYGGKQSIVQMMTNIKTYRNGSEDMSCILPCDKPMISNELHNVLRTDAVKNTINAITTCPNGKQLTFPVISISNKTGFYIDVIKDIIANVPEREIWGYLNGNKLIDAFKSCLLKKDEKIDLDTIFPKIEQQFDGSIFYCNMCFNPPGVGLVMSGIQRGMTSNVGDIMYLGPINDNRKILNNIFIPVRLKTMRNDYRQPVYQLKHHDRGSIAFALENKKDDFERKKFIRGMVMISSPNYIKYVCYRFDAIISMYGGKSSLTLKTGSSLVFQCGTIVQSVKLTIDPEKNYGKDVLIYNRHQTDVAIVTCKFISRAEFLEPRSRFELRSGDLQGVGIVLKVLSITDDPNPTPDVKKPRGYRKGKGRQNNRRNKAVKPA